ncbi:MAG: RAMP superfamily protein [Anaerolineae bacterium]|nr:RAMP superfamily protein [Anaerolineae bacterium]
MTETMRLSVELLSDTTFGRGDGVVGVVDEEVEHDAATGLPIIRGRVLKGLLVEACADILYALGSPSKLVETAQWLFGIGGSDLTSQGHVRIGRAELPEDLVRYVRHQKEHTPMQILESLTTIRRQTAIDEARFGAPQEGSLRSSRVVLRNLVFTAPLHFDQQPQEEHLALLAACAAGVKRGGSGRNRGRGKLRVQLEGAAQSHRDLLKAFERAIR